MNSTTLDKSKTNSVELGKKGTKTDKKWIQKAVKPSHRGFCTPMTKSTCTPRRKALARTFKKMAKHRIGGTVLPDINPAGIPLQGINIPDKLPMVNVPIPKPEQNANISFGAAFKQARDKGLDKFSWNGKLYTTEMKTATTNKPAVKDRVAATKVDATKDKITPAKSTVTPAKSTVTPEVTSNKPHRYVTNIQQAREVLKGRDVLPQNNPKVYRVADHQGFLEKHAQGIGVAADIIGTLMTGASMSGAKALGALGTAGEAANISKATRALNRIREARAARSELNALQSPTAARMIKSAKATRMVEEAKAAGVASRKAAKASDAVNVVRARKTARIATEAAKTGTNVAAKANGGSIDFLLPLIEAYKNGGQFNK